MDTQLGALHTQLKSIYIENEISLSSLSTLDRTAQVKNLLSPSSIQLLLYAIVPGLSCIYRYSFRFYRSVDLSMQFGIYFNARGRVDIIVKLYNYVCSRGKFYAVIMTHTTTSSLCSNT